MLHYVLIDINYYLEDNDNSVRIVQDLEFVNNSSSYNVCMIIGTRKSITNYLNNNNLSEYVDDIKRV